MRVEGSRIVTLAALVLLAGTLALSAAPKPTAVPVSAASPVVAKPPSQCPSGWHYVPNNLGYLCMPDKPALRCGAGTVYVEHTGPATRLQSYGGPSMEVPDCSIGCRWKREATDLKQKASSTPKPSEIGTSSPLRDPCPAGWHIKGRAYEKNEDGAEQFTCVPKKVTSTPPSCPQNSVFVECDCAFGCMVGIH